MIRENRFTVLRNKDIEKFLTVEQKVLLADLIQYVEYHREAAENRPSKNYVVIADNWPMYETVWAMVEAFVDRNPSEIESLRAEIEALKQQVEQGKRDAVPEDIRKDAERYRQLIHATERDCYQLMYWDTDRDSWYRVKIEDAAMSQGEQK